MTVRLCIFLLIWIYGFYTLILTIVNKIIERNQELDGEQSDSPVDGVAFKIMKKALKKIGCQPEVEKDGVINFAFQGEHFQIVCDRLYARIWDPAWGVLKADDPNLPTIREAINRANIGIYPTVFLTPPDEENNILFHFRMDILLHPSLPRIEDYVKCSLNALFQAKEAVRAEYQNIGIGQQMEQKKRRKVGFYQPEDGEQDNTHE